LCKSSFKATCFMLKSLKQCIMVRNICASLPNFCLNFETGYFQRSCIKEVLVYFLLHERMETIHEIITKWLKTYLKWQHDILLWIILYSNYTQFSCLKYQYIYMLQLFWEKIFHSRYQLSFIPLKKTPWIFYIDQLGHLKWID
jgi:hypothetical protein